MRDNLVFVIGSREPSFAVSKVGSWGSGDLSALTYEELTGNFTIKKDGFRF